MEHIVYIYISSHKVLPNLGLRFDSHYEIQTVMLPLRDQEFHLTPFKVSINKDDGLIDGFYGKHIKCLTAIVGNNGAGKTSALRFLLDAVVSGSSHSISGFVVTEEDDKSLCIYHSNDVQIKIDSPEVNVRLEQGWPEISTFLYSGHVNILTNSEDIMTTELAGMVNASEGYLLTSDLMFYGRESTTNGNFSLRDYATAFNCQNQWRICNFLSQYEGPLKSLLHLPQYVLVLPNTAGIWSLSHRVNEKERMYYPKLKRPNEWTFKEFRLAELIYYSLVNYISDDLVERATWDGIIQAWNARISEHYQGDIVKLFEEFIYSFKQIDQNHDYLEFIHEVIKNICALCEFDEHSLSHYFYFRVDDENMKSFIRLLQEKPSFIAGRFFDLYYAHDIDDYTILSSGEKAMLDMYSRIYDAVISKHNRNTNHIWPTLFIFDEAEIGFHPEWQRSFVKNVTTFLEEMATLASKMMRIYQPYTPDFHYQVILSSHSPIILSDVPSECAIMLKKESGDDNNTKNVSATRQQTFGTNIFELYRDSFFMNNGLMGVFAEDVIKAIINDIETSNNLESIPGRIQLIGDPQIKSYLTMKYASINKDVAISLLEDQIRHIKEGL